MSFRIVLLKIIIFFLLTTSCGVYKYTDQRNQPSTGIEKARKNIEEGKGIGVKGLIGSRGSTSYEFSSSNSMWRASLEILDFLPLTTVDYSGGIIITDWYSSDTGNNNSQIKITVRFLDNQIRSDSFKVIVHQKICKSNNSCEINEIDSKIKEELIKSILAKATIFENTNKSSK